MILFLKPYFEKKPWAGKILSDMYDCPSNVGEAWLVSGISKKSSVIANGKYKGMTLRKLWQDYPRLFGEYPDKEFPILVKIIDANEDLSVQVHPNDDYALKKHNQLGKFECWYILPQTKNINVTLGVNCKNTLELKQIINDNLLNKFLVQKEINPNDLVIVEPGKVHAINAGTFLLEIQESSDITYRLYDYNRIPLRPLHINDALNVISFNNEKNNIHNFSEENEYQSEFFDVKKIIVKDNIKLDVDSFFIVHVLKNNGFINNTLIEQKDTFIVTVDEKEVLFKGEMELLIIKAKPKPKERIKMRKVALITGITSPDGVHLAEFLLNKNYEVHGLIESINITKHNNLTTLVNNEEIYKKFLFLHVGNLTDSSNINRIIEHVRPDEIYNLAEQNHVDTSFEMPEYTTQVNSLGVLRLLDAIKDFEVKAKLFNLSSCQLYSGDSFPQDENTPFDPKSPYAITKMYAHYMVKNYREYYNIFAVNGICFNHDSPKYSKSFVLRKIIDAAKKIANNEEYILELGNLNSIREWGNSIDYVEAMWLTLQQNHPKDYTIATGLGYSIRDLVKLVYKQIGIEIEFINDGIEEVGIGQDKKTYIIVNPKLLRINDASVLVGNAHNLYLDTKWKAKCSLEVLISDMLRT